MRRMLVLGWLAMSITAAQAQVIGGESTYEDNFLHDPPRSDDPRQRPVRERVPDRARAPTPSQRAR